ncbi:MAG: VWA domain-containing protein [Sandaracinaceae bacterium]|nr:MAG: VWA domain-containing protein [Sandaracinaceae bacterium]
MTRVVWCWMGALFWALLAIGCDCSGPHNAGGPCAGPRPPDTCDVPCSAEMPCEGAYYCADQGVCTADCDPLRPAEGCPRGLCQEDGRCVSLSRPDADVDATGICADVRVQARRVTPNVILIVDQSGSMTADFAGGRDRWDALRDSLMDEPDGLVYSLQSSVRFGLALYSAEADGNSSDPVPGMCPLVEWVGPALDNHGALQAVYGPADPIDETPTGASIDSVLDFLAMSPDPSADPTIFILATDGEPDTCAQPNPQEGQPEALAAAERAYRMGIRTFIISVGEGTISERHLQDMANAGLGRGAGDADAEFWVAGDDAGLRTALTDIVAGELSCVVTLEGRIQNLDDACAGTVRLNGTALSCDDPDGWRVLDESHIELQGEACMRLQSGPGATLEASFPCDVILI